MQHSDLRYVVLNFWSCQSVLSGEMDMALLKMTRWKEELEWSPWNCFLVTHEEAEAHAEVEDLVQVI